MASRQRKTEKRRQQRQRKKKYEVRRLTHHRTQWLESDVAPLHACMVNEEWREQGKASIFVARSVSPTSVTMAAFLVDLWAMGLKDAWGRIDLSVSEFSETIESMDEGLGACPLNLTTARHIVYGGIELSRELGFRLPRKYERWVDILGPLPEGESPDMSLFCPDGKIHLCCSQRDFEGRLVGTTPEKFLARPDVEFTMDLDDFSLLDDDEEDDEVDEIGSKLEAALLVRTRQWCFANGQVPHPLLPKIIGATMETVLQCAPDDSDLDDEEPSLGDSGGFNPTERIIGFLEATQAGRPADLMQAAEQFQSFMSSMESPEELFETLGMEDS